MKKTLKKPNTKIHPIKRSKEDKALYLITAIETPTGKEGEVENVQSVPLCFLNLDKANSWEEVFMQVNQKFKLNPSLGLMLVPVSNKPQIAMLYQNGFQIYPFSDVPIMCMTRFIYDSFFSRIQNSLEEEMNKTSN